MAENFHLITSKRNVECYPEPNALNPCEDIMGSYWLRISVWFVVVLAILGNLAVMVVVMFSGSEMTVSKFLMCNLAFADFCMGLYLLLIASMDLHSVGSYFNLAYDWQYGESLAPSLCGSPDAESRVGNPGTKDVLSYL